MKNTLARSLSMTTLLASLSLAAPSMAQAATTTDAQPAATSEDFAFARRLSRVFGTVAKKTEPAVVHITQQRMMYQTDFFGRRVGRGRMMQSGLGSGAIIGSDGIVVTNNHVVEGGEITPARKTVDGVHTVPLLSQQIETGTPYSSRVRMG